MHPRKKNKRTARDIAHDLLSRREHTNEELYRKLLLRGVSESEARTVVDRLTEAGIVDDRRACDVFLRSELLKKPQGRIRLRLSLAKRYVPAVIIQEYLEPLDDAWEEAEAKRAAKVWLRMCRKRENKKEALVRHLRSRGFGWAAIRTAAELIPTESGIQ